MLTDALARYWASLGGVALSGEQRRTWLSLKNCTEDT